MATSSRRPESGLPTNRAEAFSDGVFAVAITLLVFNIAVPEVHRGGLHQALLNEWPAYASYAVSFLTIGIIWVNHHATMARIERVDRPFLFINLLLLMSVSFIPFPTNLLSHYIQSGPDARVAAVVYASTMTVMSLAFSGIWIYAVRRGLLHQKRVNTQAARSTIPRFGAGMVVYGLSIVLAFFSPIGSLALFAFLAIFYIFDQQASAEVSISEADTANP
ncbi:MAG TPA: TMEM175 family protein [Chloroflexota bacterium]